MTAIHQFIPFTEVEKHELSETCWCGPTPIVVCATLHGVCYGQDVLKHWPKGRRR